MFASVAIDLKSTGARHCYDELALIGLRNRSITINGSRAIGALLDILSECSDAAARFTAMMCVG